VVRNVPRIEWALYRPALLYTPVEVTCDERCAAYTDGLRAALRQLFGSALLQL
jgi:hypothetical protein